MNTFYINFILSYHIYGLVKFFMKIHNTSSMLRGNLFIDSFAKALPIVIKNTGLLSAFFFKIFTYFYFPFDGDLLLSSIARAIVLSLCLTKLFERIGNIYFPIEKRPAYISLGGWDKSYTSSVTWLFMLSSQIFPIWFYKMSSNTTHLFIALNTIINMEL